MRVVAYRIFLWILVLNQCKADTLRCAYSETLGYHLAYYSSDSYTCNLKSIKSTSNSTNIGGKHKSGKTNADVENLNVMNLKYKSFTVTCTRFPNLKLISLESSGIESLNEYDIRYCNNLKVFRVRGSNLQEVSKDLLFDGHRLTRLDITDAKLTSLPESLLQGQSELDYLDLSNNEIRFLPSRFFEPVMNLLFLYLDNNKLRTLNPKWFEDANRLSTLALNGNQIADLQAGIFKPLKTLSYLQLERNRLTMIDADIFSPDFKDLEVLRLNDNKIIGVEEALIDNVYINEMSVVNSTCAPQGIFWRKGQGILKEGLRKCFENYQPRSANRFKEEEEISTTKKYSLSKPPQPDSCGRVIVAQTTIVGGTKIVRGSYPWIAALVHNTGSYFCGGSVVSDRKIVTAAHCIQDKGQSQPFLARDIIVLLGMHDLAKQQEVGRISHAIERIEIHPDWNHKTVRSNADIAVLVVEQEIKFGRFIYPICLIDPESDIKDIRLGVVVGYGRSEDLTKNHENIPKVINTPIHDNEVCYRKYSGLAVFASERTFCGGYGNGTGTCNGDSGNALAVFDEGVYYLRGIVSTSLKNLSSKIVCDVNSYSLFTDMLKFKEWVDSVDTEHRS